MEDAEEHAIHDYEGFEGLRIDEYDGVESVIEKAEFIAEHGELGANLANYHSDMKYAKEALDEHYAGEYDSVEEFAQQLTEETTDIPQSLQFYIDYERMARDLKINDVLAIELGFEEVHIFWQH